MGLINVDPECIIIYWFIIFNVTTSFSPYIRKMNMYGERHNGIERKIRKLGIVSIELHYDDVIMTMIASQITSLTVVNSFIQTQMKENIKAPRHWPLSGEFTGTGEFPAQRASYAENVSIWWRHHVPWLKPAIVAFLSAIDTQGSWATKHDSQYQLSVFFWEVRCNDNFYPKGDHLLIRCLVYGAVYVWDKNDYVIKWKHFPRYWPFVRGIHRPTVNSPHKGQWRGALMFCFICAWKNGWVNNGEAGNLRRHRTHYDITEMNNHDDAIN